MLLLVKMRPRSRNDFTIAIICALPLEADAVEALFDETYDRLGKYYGKQPGDANAYMNGRIGMHNVVLCYLPGMGKGSAASVASSLQVSYTGVELALVVVSVEEHQHRRNIKRYPLATLSSAIL